MVHLVKKKQKENIYLYLEHRRWINNKSEREFSIYLGSEKKLIQNPKRLRILEKNNFEIEILDFGLPAILWRIAEKLGIIDIINQATNKRNQSRSVGEHIVLAAINRCVQPTSKTLLEKWLNSTYLKIIFPFHEENLDSASYVNHFKYISEETVDEFELEIIQKLQQIYGIKMDHFLYDPTNFYTYINPINDDKQQLAKHGKSKENKNTLNLVALSLICTRDEGIPIMHQVYPGNTMDATHFKNELPRFINRLDKLGIDSSSVVLVFDKGNISEDAFEIIDNTQMKWIAAVRPSSHKDLDYLTEEDFIFDELPNGKEVGVLEYKRKMHHKERRLIVSHNKQLKSWNSKNFLKKVHLRIKTVEEFFDNRLNIKKWRSKGAVIQKIEKVIGKKFLPYIEYHVNGAYGVLKFSIKINSELTSTTVETMGKTYLMTNDQISSGFDIVWQYRQQYTVEKAFSYLKGPNLIRLRPMFHRIDTSIRGHIFSSVVALLLLMLLEKEVRDIDPNLSIPTILKLLKEIKIANLNFGNNEPGMEKIASMSKEARNLFNKLQIGDLLVENSGE